MEPFKAKKLPFEYGIDKELLNLISEANQKYGEYKSHLSNLEFDHRFFLDSILLNESLKSTQIEGTQISQDDMYYLKYMPQTDDNIEIRNLKSAVEFGQEYINDHKEIDLKLLNEMHKILLNSVRGCEKSPGSVRNIQNWIGPRGATIEDAIFVPPVPEDVPVLLDNLFKYMNDAYIDPIFVNLAISHSQFETIHPYRDGNGRVGRALIPIQLALLSEDKPMLFMSEVIELYKPSYQKFLNDSRKGNMLGFIKFFMQCIIEQCNSYIFKIKRIKKIYKDDMEKVKSINGASIHVIMPILIKQIVFTKSELEKLTNLSRSTINRIIDRLVKLGIIVPDSKRVAKGYKYLNVYNVFVGGEIY